MARHTRRTSTEAVVRRAGVPVVIAAGFLASLGGTSVAAPVVPGPGPGATAPAPSGSGSTPGTDAATMNRSPSGEGSTSPCGKTVKACARLSTNEVWVTDGAGKVLRGPIAMTHGAKGEETPVGSFRVTAKDADHVSQEQAGVKMPYSVFFDDHGRAFHGGSLSRQSAGCVHLSDDDAKFLFDHLAVGDQVQILR